MSKEESPNAASFDFRLSILRLKNDNRIQNAQNGRKYIRSNNNQLVEKRR